MQDVFKIEGVTKRTSFKIRKAIYLQRCFESAPVTVQVADSLSSLRERKCVTQLAHDAYTQDGIPNPITPQQIEKLNALNDILFADDKTNRRVRPMQLEMITQEDNAWILKHTRIYLKNYWTFWYPIMEMPPWTIYCKKIHYVILPDITT
jgi:hypothetical protein